MPTRAGCVCLVALMLGGCANTPPDDPSDPLESVNRGIYSFNHAADHYVLRPVAQGYDKVTPSFVRTGIANFFANLYYPTTIVNDVLQLKLLQFTQDVGRFTLNTTFGLGGIIDAATPVGLAAHDEDFGQTLGHWGVGPGWYLMLPLLGPADNRDLVGRAGDWYTRPVSYVSFWPGLGLSALDTIEKRAEFLGADHILDEQLDPYVFLRTIYLQQRLNLVYDGNPTKEDFGLDDDSAPMPAKPKPKQP